MKLSLTLAALQGAAAFNAGAAMVARPSVRMNPVAMMAGSTTSSPWSINEITPDGALTQRVEGLTRKTWTFNDVTKDRVQVAVTSEGRPCSADIQLWIGPDWTPCSMKAYSEDGKLRPDLDFDATHLHPRYVESDLQRALDAATAA